MVYTWALEIERVKWWVEGGMSFMLRTGECHLRFIKVFRDAVMVTTVIKEKILSYECKIVGCTKNCRIKKCRKLFCKVSIVLLY